MPNFRLLRIFYEFLRFAVAGAIPASWSRSRLPPPQGLCLSLARLGTTFIKFGQALSLRRELLPDAYIVALQSLQDHVAPFASEDAMREIERGLGRPIERVFAHIERQPLAAASVAQVHAARLLDGREVIVKVRRIGVKQMIERDMRALVALTRAAMVAMPRLRAYQPLRLIDEIADNLRREIDFRREARNIRTFAAAFADWPTRHVPDVINDLVSETVIVQERSAGKRIDDPAIGADGPRLAQNFVDAYLHQIFVIGFFHGDPHPGNLFITPEGRICFHDFGLTGFLDRGTRRNLAAFTTAFIRHDADWLLDAGIDLGVLGGEMDRNAFRHGLADIIADYAALPLKDWSLADALLRVARLGREQNVFIPYELAILMRMMFLAESVVRILDPDFQLLESLQAKGPTILKATMEPSEMNVALDHLKFDAVMAMQDFPAVLGSWVRRLNREREGLELGLRIQGLKGLEEHLDRSNNRLALALVTLGLYIAGSLLMQHSIGPRFLGDVPALAAFFYVLALWFTFRLARAILRSGRL